MGDRRGIDLEAMSLGMDQTLLREGTGSETSTISRAGNMFSQLESMMSAVRKEAIALETMKARLQELDDLKALVPDLRAQLQDAHVKKGELERGLRDSDKLYQQLRNDMQRLNDLYNSERKQHLDCQNSNVQLDSDLSRVQQENTFLQREVDKIADLRRKNQALQQQLASSEEQMEDVKRAAQKNILSLKKKLDDSEQSKAETYALLTQSSEEISNLKADLRKLSEEKTVLQQGVLDMRERSHQDMEQLRRRLDDSVSKEDRLMESMAQNESDMRKLQDSLNAKSDHIDQLQSKLRSVEDARAADRADLLAKMGELNEAVSAMQSKMLNAQRGESEAIHKLATSNAEVSRCHEEIDRLSADLREKTDQWNGKEMLIAQQMQILSSGRDEAMEKAVVASNQLEALQDQIRDMQTRHWEELQRCKEAEAQIAEEAEALQQELHEKSMQVISLEANRAKVEEIANSEVVNAAQLSTTLRQELEKRLEELMQARKERDQLTADKCSLLEKVSELEQAIKRNDALFKKTLESDRAKIQQEVRSKLARLKTLESDKQDLLRETSELMDQMTAMRREVAQAQQMSQDSKRALENQAGELEAANNTRLVLEMKLSDAMKKEAALVETTAASEARMRSEIEKFEQMAKDSKKDSAQHIIDLTSQLRFVTDELDAHKRRVKELDANEKKAWADADKVRAELDVSTRAHEKMQQQMAEEVTALKRENREQKMKIGLMSDSKARSDQEMMTLNVEMTRSENEIGRMRELLREAEGKLQSMQEKIVASRNEAESVTQNYNRSKVKVVELEESLVKKNKLIEKQAKDITKLERDGISEVKRLRLLLATSEHELIELKPLVSSLQKEISDGKAAFARLQSSTAVSVNGLLEELRSTEDALSTERKKNQSDIEGYHSRIADLQSSLEKAREHIEEHNSKSKYDKNDKEMRLQQLERETDRLREAISTRERRIEELEKQRQGDRSRLHELREQLDSVERNLVEARASVELEQTQRRALEARLRQVDADLVDSSTMLSLRSQNLGNDDSARPDTGDDLMAASFGGNANTRSVKDAAAHTSFLSSPSRGVEDWSSVPSYLDPNSLGSLSTAEAVSPLNAAGSLSPAVDRVSQALAQRAAAESSKNALRQAQQLRLNRQNPTALQSSSAASTSRGLSSRDNMDSEDGSAFDSSLASDYDSNRPVHLSPQQQQQQQQQQLQHQQQQQQQQQQNQNYRSAQRTTFEEPKNVEDSISKTQSFLQRRLAAQARMSSSNAVPNTRGIEGGGTLSSSSSMPTLSASDTSDGPPSSTAPRPSESNQSYLQAAISASQLAAAAFEKHKAMELLASRQQRQTTKKEVVDDMESFEHYQGGGGLSPPSLQPSAPPRFRSSNHDEIGDANDGDGAYENDDNDDEADDIAMGSQSYREEEDDDVGGDEGGGPDSGRGSSLNAVMTSKPKKSKSKDKQKKSKKSADSLGDASGFLPKISQAKIGTKVSQRK